MENRLTVSFLCSYIIIAAYFFIHPSISFGQESCDSVLLAKTVTVMQSSSKSKLAWLQLINSSNYEEAKKNYSAQVPGYFNGSYKDFSVKRSEYFSKESYSQNTEEARATLSISTPPENVSAWRSCVLANSGGLSHVIEHVSESSATLIVAWNPPLGSGEITELSLFLDGGYVLQTLPTTLLGQRSVIISRDEVNKGVSGTISGIVNGVSYTTTLYIPATPNPPPPCNSKNRTISVDVGANMFAIARIPASQCDRNINVRVVARAIYETPGDPWVSLEVKIPGIISPWNSGRLGVPAESPSYRDAKFNQTISLPAGQSMDVIANTANFRAKADFLRIEADITEP